MAAPSKSWQGWSENTSGATESPKWWEPEGDSIDWNALPPETAGIEFANLVVSLKLSNAISAKQACLLALWASKAGAVGEAKKFALHPEAPSGHYSRKFDDAVGTKPCDLPSYAVPLARRLRHDASRQWAAIPMIPPHEALDRELRSSPEAAEELEQAWLANELPRRFVSHPAVAAAADERKVHPFCLYLDGVAYSRLDSCLGVWVYFMLSGQRHLVAVLRRCELCSCGCRGWCSLHPLFRMLAWSFSAMLDGRWPSARHDGAPWEEADADRARAGGRELGWRAVCCFVKGDWSEYCHTLGFPSWADSVAPCPFCFCQPGDLYRTTTLSAVAGPSAPKSTKHYRDACARCEVWADLRPETLEVARATLAFDKRRNGSAGRALVAPMPSAGLERGDRLEPSSSLPDVAALEAPGRTLFWRRSKETLARHRNPLFDEGTGLGIDALGIDWLHTLSLGVFPTTLAHFVWALFDANAWGVPGGAASVLELSVARMRAELFQWYSSEQKAGRTHTRVQQLLPSLFGSRQEHALKLHGSECNGFLFFSLFLLERYGESLGAKKAMYQDALGSLANILTAIKRYPRAVPVRAMQEFVDNVCQHVRAAGALGIPMKPKHHFLIEMASRPLSGTTDHLIRI